MSDIELVIKILEDSYKATCKGLMLPLDVENVVNAIKTGTLLPKGHGRLVDYDEMKEIAFDYGRYTESALSYIKPRVLIEADKAESEGEQDV